MIYLMNQYKPPYYEPVLKWGDFMRMGELIRNDTEIYEGDTIRKII
jgi:hypothetical protein